MPDHPKAIGDRSEAHVLAALLDHYPTVLTPWGEDCRYDFVVETHEVRLDPTRNGQSAGIRWAAQYELGSPE